MPQHVRVELDLLEGVFALLVARLRAENGSAVSLDRDYFWSIAPDEVFDVDSAPQDLGIGQVSECLDWLEALKNDPESALPYHLVWLGDALRALGNLTQADFRGPRGDVQ